MKYLLCVLLFAAIGVSSFTGCSDLKSLNAVLTRIDTTNLKDVSTQIGQGAVDGIKRSLADTTKPRADSLFSHLIGVSLSTAIDTMLSDSTRKLIDSLIANVIANVDKPANKQHLDSLITNLSSTLSSSLDTVLHKALGPGTGNLLKNLIASALSDSNFNRLIRLRDTLIGAPLSNEIDSEVAKLMDSVASGIKYKINPALQLDLSAAKQDVTQTGTTLAWIFGGIAAVLIAFGTWMYILRRRYQGISELMTNEIDQIPDKNAYDELVHRISRNAKTRKLEPHLRNILKQQGLLGTENWIPPVKS